MELFEEILLKSLKNQSVMITINKENGDEAAFICNIDTSVNIINVPEIKISFPDFQFDAERVVSSICYKTLNKIRAIISDDRECFIKIEEIVLAFETIGSNGGVRHDF